MCFPEVTEVVNVRQGGFVGVYNKDQTVCVYAGLPYRHICLLLEKYQDKE